MTFLVRSISRTADGRDIVRPVTFEHSKIDIGRDASNDIHLPDLAVNVFHATLTMQPSGKIVAESVGGLEFAVDGRPTKRIEIDGHRGAELRFGGHLLKLAMEDGIATLSVERIDAVSDSNEDADQTDAFSLKGLLPGKRISAWSFFVLVLAACLAWPIYSYATWRLTDQRPAGLHADTAWSSGSLSEAHHSLEGDCQSCHDKAFVAVEDAKCASCHADTSDHAEPKRQALAQAPAGVGGEVANFFRITFGKPTGQRCVDCHSEHEGAGPMAATAQAFCTDCHATLKTRVGDTKLADAGDFGTAHPQFRPAVAVGFDNSKPILRRLSLDARPTENNGLKFPHKTHLSLTNGVAKMTQTMRGEQGWGNALACKDCHTPTADGVRFEPVAMERDCQMCHDLAFDRIGGTVRTLRHGEPREVVADLRAFYRSTGPARPIMLGGRQRTGNYAAAETRQDSVAGARAYAGGAAQAIDAVFSKGGACFDCHVVDRTGDARSAGWRIGDVVQPARYMSKGWFDHAAHKTESCSSCHTASTSLAASDLLLPALGTLGDKGGKTCRSCHGGEASKAAVPSNCAMCHSYHTDDGAPAQARKAAGAAKGHPRFRSQPPGPIALR